MRNIDYVLVHVATRIIDLINEGSEQLQAALKVIGGHAARLSEESNKCIDHFTFMNEDEQDLFVYMQPWVPYYLLNCWASFIMIETAF